MGSGVSKQGIPNAPQGHHWSDAEHHFWCCQGSGIEAFARLADSIFWTHNPSFGSGVMAGSDYDGDIFSLREIGRSSRWFGTFRLRSQEARAMSLLVRCPLI